MFVFCFFWCYGLFLLKLIYELFLKLVLSVASLCHRHTMIVRISQLQIKFLVCVCCYL